MSKKLTILIVDDKPSNIDVLSGVLSNDYQLKIATNGETAIKIAQRYPQPDLILLDVMMPEMDGYEVCKTLKNSNATSRIPIIFVTAKASIDDEVKGLEVGAVDYIIKPINPVVAKHRINIHLALSIKNIEMDKKVKLKTESINQSKLDMIHRLGLAAEYKDNETGSHVIRVASFSYLIAKKHGMDEYYANLLRDVAPMHDIGKIGIPDRVLLKPGSLDKEEWELMKTHVEIGCKILATGKNYSSELLSLAHTVVSSHHEKYNGLGYPKGLKGNDIPLVGRIVAIADVFDALTSVRPYKKAMSAEQAFEIIEKEKGEHFDPDLAQIFLDNKEEVKRIMSIFSESIDIHEIRDANPLLY